MAILDHVTLGIVPCSCGRLSNKIHCPYCGCYTVYGSVKKKITRSDTNTGVITEYAVYRCVKCARFFDDYQWQNECTAPEFKLKRNRKLEMLAQSNQIAIAHAQQMRKQHGLAEKKEETKKEEKEIQKEIKKPIINTINPLAPPAPDYEEMKAKGVSDEQIEHVKRLRKEAGWDN
jgi:hypothetical protein